MNQPASAYFMEDRHDPESTPTRSRLSCKNEPGVLARVIGCSPAGLQHRESDRLRDENQSMSPHHHRPHRHAMVIEQIKHQLDRMVPGYRVVDMTLSAARSSANCVVKLRGTGEHRVEALRLPSVSRARDRCHTESFVSKSPATRQDQPVIDLMRPLGLVEVSRTALPRSAAAQRMESCWPATGT